MADSATSYGGGGTTRNSQEKRLLDTLARLRSNNSGIYAVHLYLSELPASHKQPHFIRMVSRTLESLATKQEVDIYNLGNLDVVLICRNTPIDEVDDAVFQVRTIFHEDQITQTEDGSAEDRFSTWYDLSQSTDFKDFEEAVKSIEYAVKDIEKKHTEGTSTGRASASMTGEPLTPDILQDIKQKLLEARIGDLVHRQPAIKVGAGKKQELAFREHYIAMAELRKRIAPKINIFSSHWLFQYLSETIDARVLEVLSRIDYANTQYPVSVNLNVATIMSRPFQSFDAIVGDQTRKVIVEIQMIDIFANMGNYIKARDWLQDRGYRVLVDGLNPLTLDFFNPKSLKADYVKMNWGPEVQGGVGHEQTQRIKSVVGSMKLGTVVLSRVDSEEGVSWGLGLGIICYQGHFIDKVVSAMAAKGALK